ncbi:MAG: phosphoribosylglycinamide formyltransferase [Flavobacteriaceae bacterium]|nr:phosphoribosylglycinamide formyltransferase [Flavobacteriaceae bacterium]
MKRIAIFASGSGSNAENIIKYFRTNKSADVVLILSNSPDAFVLNRASRLNIKSIVFNKQQINNPDWARTNLLNYNIDLIVLAGYLWKFPTYLLKKYQNKVINLHPSLLPKYGGKGMYGTNVHKAVVLNNEVESGITIHYVNEHYDQGAIIFQAKCQILESDTFKDVADKIRKLELHHLPAVVSKIIYKYG